MSLVTLIGSLSLGFTWVVGDHIVRASLLTSGLFFILGRTNMLQGMVGYHSCGSTFCDTTMAICRRLAEVALWCAIVNLCCR